MSYSSNVLPSTSKIYKHPWYTAQEQLASTTSLESESTQKLKSETVGLKSTKYGVIPPPLDDEYNVVGANQTRFTGRHCENLVKSYLLSQGFNVAEPEVDNGCDLLFKMDGKWKSAQVKKVVCKIADNGLSYFQFFFNSTRANGKRKDSGYDVDYFFHVISTQHRQLLFMVPDLEVPRTKSGQQVMCSDLVLDRYNRVHSKKKRLNLLDYLVNSFYSPEIFKAYPDFPY